MNGKKAKLFRRYARGRGKEAQALIGVTHNVFSPDGVVTMQQAVLNHCDRLMTKLLKQAAATQRPLTDFVKRRAVLHKQGAGA
jgi:hypothetical protein